MPGRKALHMQLIDHRPIPGRSQQLVAAPGKRLIDHDAFGHVPGVILVVAREIRLRVANLVSDTRASDQSIVPAIAFA